LPTFYQNIIDQKVALVVNLTALNDRGQVKSDEYWPMKKGQEWKSTPGYVVKHREDPVARSEVIKTIHYQLRLIEEKEGGNKGREHDFDLLHITSTKEPMWVHCSAGIGRSGTVIASLLARDLGSSSLSKALNLAPMTTPSLLADGALKGAKSMVDHERRYRPKMVQTADQLGMVVSAIGDVLQAVE
jgi:protein tyrosine phosphatase